MLLLILGVALIARADELDDEKAVTNAEPQFLAGTMIVRVNNDTGEVEYRHVDSNADVSKDPSVIEKLEGDFLPAGKAEVNELDRDSGTSSFFLSFNFNSRHSYRHIYPRYGYGGYVYGGNYGRFNRGSYYFASSYYRPYYSYDRGIYSYNCYSPYYSYYWW